ncbi:hypothetical protein BDP27DRAFT_1429330 [Rhodocollybia butyracea]|uniref:Uncharacterized protein n=1 Tax=Rhodocollybia butyracea TaxID=206335 RepID=A0A9P5U113_9AGAR|nr:hypothetical protein BDP27DRAFT_1429330 [Rhodocollybia butyracea]
MKTQKKMTINDMEDLINEQIDKDDKEDKEEHIGTKQKCKSVGKELKKLLRPKRGLEALKDIARYLPGMCSPNTPLQAIFICGFEQDGLIKEGLGAEWDQEDEQRHVPDFLKYMRLVLRLEMLDCVISQMNSASSCSVSQDFRTINNLIVQFLPFSLKQSLIEPLSANKSAMKRGFAHPDMAEALTPPSRLDEFDADPEE